MTLHRLFEQQALIYADRVALCFLSDSYTYAQLNIWSNQLARFLQERYAVSAGDRVLMFLPKSATQVAVLLALSKLGAIYVPLNPRDCPDERLTNIIKSTDAKCIIVSEVREVVTSLPQLELSGLNASLQTFSVENLEFAVSENDIAYMIYTSGTTNVPKGVPIKHSGLNYWFHAMSALFHTTTAYERRVLSFCLASFDASIWEYLMAWIEGSTLYIADDATRDNPEQLKEFIERNSITHATLIPSLLRHMVTTGLPSSLQVVCSTGEACTREIVEAFEQKNKQLFNCYGATEETFGLSVQECSLRLFDEQKGAPIAYPLGEEIKIHIFDEELKEAEYGQLYVESPYLTPAYWQQEEETQKSFIIHQGKRLYKTGDYFCRDTDHNVLRYMGRMNSEVLKIRGALVNLLEIESYILELPEVEDACVVVCKRGHYDFLVANLQVKPSAYISSQEIRQYLLQRLSSTAIPAQFFMTATPLPLTSNAKKDRKKLQENYYTHRDSLVSAGDFLPIENALIEILQSVLEIDKHDIRASDTFFTLGGDSISRLVLIERIRAIFDIDVSVQDLYREDLTISTLVDLIHEYRWRKTPDSPLSAIIHQGEKAQAIFMLHPITGEATTTYYEFARSWAQQEGISSLRVYGINARGLHNSFDSSMNMNLIANDYVRAIQQKQNHGPYFVLGWSFGGVLAWKIAELLEGKGEKIKLVLIDTLCPAVTQQCSFSSYKELLFQLIEDLRRPFKIVGDFLSLSESLTTEPPENQIKAMFRSVIQNNASQSTQLQLIAGLLLANQFFTPKDISTLPYLFTCAQTQNKTNALIPVTGINFASTLGWSSVKHSLTLTLLASATTHFDFVMNHEVIKCMLGTLNELLPLQKELEPEVSHNSDHETLLSLQAQLAWLTNFVIQQAQGHGQEVMLPAVYSHPHSGALLYSGATGAQTQHIGASTVARK